MKNSWPSSSCDCSYRKSTPNGTYPVRSKHRLESRSGLLCWDRQEGREGLGRCRSGQPILCITVTDADGEGVGAAEWRRPLSTMKIGRWWVRQTALPPETISPGWELRLCCLGWREQTYRIQDFWWTLSHQTSSDLKSLSLASFEPYFQILGSFGHF